MARGRARWPLHAAAALAAAALLLAAAASAAHLAATPQQFWAGVEDPSVSAILITQPLWVAGAAFAGPAAVRVGRPLSISAAAPAIALDFDMDTRTLINVTAGGALHFASMVISAFHPETMLPLSDQTYTTVVACIALAPAGAATRFTDVTFLVNHTYTQLVQEMPFWGDARIGAQRIQPSPGPSGAQGSAAPGGAADAPMTAWAVSYAQDYHGGSSIAAVEGGVLLTDTQQCYGRAGQSLVYDSASLAGALAAARQPGPALELLLFQNTTLAVDHFNLSSPATVARPVLVHACAGVTFCLNGLQQVGSRTRPRCLLRPLAAGAALPPPPPPPRRPRCAPPSALSGRW